MIVNLPSIIWPTWTRNINGENFYDVTSFKDWGLSGTNLEIAQNHPILTPAILFVSKIFSQAEFFIEKNSTGEKAKNHSLLELFKKPNPYQTTQDFLESLMFIQIAQGVCIVYKKKIIGFDEPKQLYILDYNLIEWPEELKNNNYKTKILDDKTLDLYIIYDANNENLRIKIRDLMFFYDLPNCMNRNPFKVKSRMDGLKQTLINTNDSLIAKNIILKSNGKELITGTKDGFPLTPEEKQDMEHLVNNTYGLSFTRKRGIVTKANLNWKSLHIALRDLGLDESVKVDGNLIYTALHIPKDILSLEAKKTTYNNFKESMSSYMQNEMQASLNSAVSVFQSMLDNRYTLKGSFEHMPIMQFTRIERYKSIAGQAEALAALRNAGLPDDIALEYSGFDKTIKLNELIKIQQNGEGQQAQA
jgi:hypothetical protein